MKFTIPGEPVGKGRPRVVHVKNRAMAFTPEKTVNYEALVKVEFQRQCPDLWIPDAPIRVAIDAFFALSKSDSRKKREAKLDGVIRPTKKPDCDNLAKAILDALNGLAYGDDAQVVSLSVNKRYAEIPRVEVEIEEAL